MSGATSLKRVFSIRDYGISLLPAGKQAGYHVNKKAVNYLTAVLVIHGSETV